jgi:hypothetical protein
VSWLDDPLIKAAVPLAPDTLLRTLAGVATGETPPFLTVHLSGGHVLGGGLVAVGTDRGTDVVVLSDPDSGRLGYALLSAVVAVELLTEEFPVDVDWAALGGSGLMASNLATLLHALRDAVAQVRADDMGQRAWAQVRTLRVEHHAGSPLSVQPIAGGMAVHADLSAALPRALPGELVRKISALL